MRGIYMGSCSPQAHSRPSTQEGPHTLDPLAPGPTGSPTPEPTPGLVTLESQHHQNPQLHLHPTSGPTPAWTHWRCPTPGLTPGPTPGRNCQRPSSSAHQDPHPGPTHPAAPGPTPGSAP
mmetsp:Transcript_19303/g.27832  ORF Transcript_19303/g.27832 Transcript_19303/m.27832 type:complete len:120 (+) Transcript_19303:66-425(+)